MHIMFINHAMHCGGTDRVVAKMLDILSAGNEHKYSLLTIRSGSEDFFDIPDNVNRFSLNYDADDEEVSGAGYINLNSFKMLYSLRKYIKQEKPDLIISNWTSTNCLTLLAALFTKYKVICYEHMHFNHPSLIWTTLRRLLYPTAQLVVGLTDSDVQKLSTFSNAQKVPNPITTKKKEKVTSYLDRQNQILAVGRATEQKGFDSLLLAFQPIAKEFSQWKLNIVGDGSELKSLIKMAEDLKITDQVIFSGQVRNVEDYYDQSKIFVLSSRFEGFGLVILEAQLSETPVISFNCPTGPSDIIEDKINGLLIEDQNIQALSSAIKNLILNEDQAMQLVSNANKSIEVYKDENNKNIWLKIFNENK